VSARYQVLPPTAPVPAPDDVIEQLVRQGAQRLLQAALAAEVDELLGRGPATSGSASSAATATAICPLAASEWGWGRWRSASRG
jgi:hypothetical protein